MNTRDIEVLEKELKVTLPETYTMSMLNYPFEEDSFATEFMLLNDRESLGQLNELERADGRFYIGSDGGEELYFIKPDNPGVFAYNMEKDRDKPYCESLEEFVEIIAKELLNIQEDERILKEKKENKKWWQFWI